MGEELELDEARGVIRSCCNYCMKLLTDGYVTFTNKTLNTYKYCDATCLYYSLHEWMEDAENSEDNLSK